MKGTVERARVLYCDIDDTATLDDLSTRTQIKIEGIHVTSISRMSQQSVRQYLHLYCISALHAYKHKVLQNIADGLDVTELMSAHGEFELGIASIDEIHLSCLNTSPSGNVNGEYYQSECIVKFS